MSAPAIDVSSERLSRLTQWLDACGVVLRVAAPMVDLLVRLSLAKAFFAPGMLPSNPFFEFGPTGWPTIIVQIVGPTLLAIGLWMRPISLLMLVLTLLAQNSGPPQDEHLFWAVLFGWYVSQGAGPLSLDHLLAKGLGLSPLPFAERAMASSHWFDRHVSPIYRLFVRLWLAAALVGTGVAPAMLPAMGLGTLPRFSSVIAAMMLAVGLATPLTAALLLLAASSLTMMAQGPFLSLYALLLLALLGASGAGRYSLDHLIGRRIRRRASLPDDAPHIVVVGAGFGGMACAAGLRHAPARVTLLDRRNYHLFQPLLYQVATGSLSPADIASPVRNVFREDAKLRVLCGSVSGVDVEARCIMVDGRRLRYDSLVLATGASHSYFGNEHWAAFAPGLKSIEDATSIRSRILAAFERAEATDDPSDRITLLTFLVCGAGPTGVELAGAIAELARHGMAKGVPHVRPGVRANPTGAGGPPCAASVRRGAIDVRQVSLEALGVEVRVNSRVEQIDAKGVIVMASASPPPPCCGQPASLPRRPRHGSAESLTGRASSRSSLTCRCPVCPMCSRSATPRWQLPGMASRRRGSRPQPNRAAPTSLRCCAQGCAAPRSPRRSATATRAASRPSGARARSPNSAG